MPTKVDFYRRVLERIVRIAGQRARPLVLEASRTLADAMAEEVDEVAGTARLYIPHFWAVYVHDGRGPFGPRRGKYLCWFEDTRDDPRLARGFPVRFTDVLTLRQVWTREQFQAALRENRRRAIRGEPPFMIFQRFHPGEPPHRFFEEGMRGLLDEVRPILIAEFNAYVREVIGPPQRVTASMKIRMTY